jgi:hypothetical protein
MKVEWFEDIEVWQPAHTAIPGFINDLKRYEKRKSTNREPDNLNRSDFF